MSTPTYRPKSNRDLVVRLLIPDRNLAQYFASVMRFDGYQVELTFTAHQFAEMDITRPANIYVLDLAIENFGLLEALRARLVPPPVIALSDASEPRLIVQAMKAGAQDVLIKPLEMLVALQAVADAASKLVRAQTGSGSGDAGFASLTPREREVLQLVSLGRSNKEAGLELGVSPRTIEVHRARAMEKVGAKNTAELVRLVLSR